MASLHQRMGVRAYIQQHYGRVIDSASGLSTKIRLMVANLYKARHRCPAPRVYDSSDWDLIEQAVSHDIPGERTSPPYEEFNTEAFTFDEYMSEYYNADERAVEYIRQQLRFLLWRKQKVPKIEFHSFALPPVLSEEDLDCLVEAVSMYNQNCCWSPVQFNEKSERGD